jgi:molybdate transport repressor ModE-like protein
MPGPHVPDLVGMEVLLAVRDSGSLGAAARRLGLSQQAVSSRLRAMEAVMGLELVSRTRRGSELTPDGRRVAALAGKVLLAAAELEAGVEGLRGVATSTMRIAASFTVADYLLPGWLVALQETQRDLHIDLVTLDSDDVIAAVRDGSARLGFIETPLLPDGLHTMQVGVDELVVIVAPGHRWTRRTAPLAMEELVGTRLVTREPGSGTRQSFEVLVAERLRGAALAPPDRELRSTSATKAAVASGAAPAVISARAVIDDVALGRLVIVPVAGERMLRPLSAVWRTGRRPAAGAVEDLVAIAMRSGAAAQQKPALQKPAQQKPAQQKPAQQKPALQKPVRQSPTTPNRG